ncbi:MAG: hypothetical protein U1E23_00770 [Reyranellaceae bacterium]
MKVPLSRLSSTALVIAASLLSNGCATAINGTSQAILVRSTPDGAQCHFEAAGQLLGTATTPGQVKVPRATHPISVVCRQPGYEEARTTLHSTALTPSLPARNLILLAGALADTASGARNSYPSPVHLRLDPLSEADRALASTAAAKLAAGTATPGAWNCHLTGVAPASAPTHVLQITIADDGTIVVGSYGGAVAQVANRNPLTFRAIDPQTSREMTFAWKGDNSLALTSSDGAVAEAGPCSRS